MALQFWLSIRASFLPYPLLFSGLMLVICHLCLAVCHSNIRLVEISQRFVNVYTIYTRLLPHLASLANRSNACLSTLPWPRRVFGSLYSELARAGWRKHLKAKSFAVVSQAKKPYSYSLLQYSTMQNKSHGKGVGLNLLGGGETAVYCTLQSVCVSTTQHTCKICGVIQVMRNPPISCKFRRFSIIPKLKTYFCLILLQGYPKTPLFLYKFHDLVSPPDLSKKPNDSHTPLYCTVHSMSHTVQ